MSIENKQGEILDDLKNKESINNDELFSETEDINEKVSKDLSIVENKIKNLKQTTIQEDWFDESILDSISWLQKEINRISQENEVEYSYVQFVYNLVKKFWNDIDLNNMNTAWYSSIYNWENYEENIIKSDTIISNISWDKPMLLFSNHNNIITSNNWENGDTYNELEKNYSITWSIESNIELWETNVIEKEIFIDDLNNINDEILFEINNLSESINVEGKTSSKMNNSIDVWKEFFISDSSSFRSLIISNLEISDIKKTKENSGTVKIKFNLYKPKNG